MDFQEYLKTSAEDIDQELEKTFQNWSKQIELLSPKLSALNTVFIQANLGGKRLRGALVKLGYEMVSGISNPEVLKAAIAYEIFQTSILAQDDIIDQATLRRGKPTLHKVLGGDHYAVSQTICLADIGFFLAVQLIADSDFPEDKKNKATSVFAQMVINTGLGEMLDVELPHQQKEKREEDVLMIHKLKTADYTITYPLLIGVALAGGGEELNHQIKTFGKSLGIAFQIQDDILGVFGDEKELGKSVTSDIEEDKNTLLITYALEHADDKQRNTLDRYYGKEKIGQEELEQIKKVFVETGALQYSQQKASELVKEANKVIADMNILDDKKKMLNEMANFLVHRSH